MKRTVTKGDRSALESVFSRAVNTGLNFKLQPRFAGAHLLPTEGKKILKPLSAQPQDLAAICREFEEEVLPFCINYSAEGFMGFPDSGNSVAALIGAVLKEFLQQDVMNQSSCGPSATFVEMAVVRWLREAVGYSNSPLNGVMDLGGIVTPGGTLSNAIAMMLAREHRRPGTMDAGVTDPEGLMLVVPRGIGHYSVKASAMWIGCGLHTIEVETNNYRYDLRALEATVRAHGDRIMAVVAYAGDSRTMTVDDFEGIHQVVRSLDPGIWLHADACHGFSLGFSRRLRKRLNGIEKFDSISMDPHKVMLVPYTLSILAVRDPLHMRMVATRSDLIIRDDYDIGQITPFVGTKQFEALKLWFMMKHFGKIGLDRLVTKRHDLARYLEEVLLKDDEFCVLNDVDINAVAFMYRPRLEDEDIDRLNRVSREIHRRMLQGGQYYLHQFSIPDGGRIRKDVVVYPLRFMCGNPNTSRRDVRSMVEYVRRLGREVSSDLG